MNIVITGPLGHIGSRLIRDLSASFGNLKIVLVDNLSTQRYCSLYNLPDKINYRFIEADILKMDLDTIIKKADLVIHLAALTDAANSFEYPEKIKNNNYNYNENIVFDIAYYLEANYRETEICEKDKRWFMDD